jgi:hypothetical protein
MAARMAGSRNALSDAQLEGETADRRRFVGPELTDADVEGRRLEAEGGLLLDVFDLAEQLNVVREPEIGAGLKAGRLLLRRSGVLELRERAERPDSPPHCCGSGLLERAAFRS